METQLTLALSEIQELLQKRKYKAALSKLERMLDSCELKYCSPLLLIDFFLLEASAVNKLLERNLLKKYKYEVKVVEELIDILQRNLSEVHYLLCSIIEERGGPTIGRSHLQLSISFPLVRGIQKKNCIKLERLDFKSKNEEKDSLGPYLEKFVTMVNVSTLNAVQIFSIYKRQINWRDLEQWLQISPISFSSLTGKLSQAKLQLFFAKMLSLEGNDHLTKAQGILQLATDQLLSCLHMANVNCHKSQGRESKHKKYSQRQKECYKLLIIALIASNKNNMKMGRQEVAMFGCDFIRSTVLNLGHGFGFFKRMLQPQLYLFDQFMRYRIQKQELMQISLLYFPQLLQKVQNAKQQQTIQNKKCLFSSEKEQRVVRSSNNQKTIIDDISTVKTINPMTKRKGNSSMLTILRNTSNHSLHQISNSKQMGDTILTQMIVGHIEQQNNRYLKMKNSIGNNTYYKKMKQKPVVESKRTLKKQRLSQPGSRSNSGIQQKIVQVKSRRDGQLAILNLQRKARIKMFTNSIQEEQTTMPVACQIQKEIQNGKQYVCLKYSEERSFQQDDVDVRKKMINIGKKTKVFIEVLFHNRGVLGIKKIVEKVQLLKKKEEQKQKMVSNRVTSSVNRDRVQVFRTNNKFKVIAEEIIRAHLETNSHNEHQNHNETLHDKQERKKHIQANFSLGQDSIETIKVKLLGKMQKKERSTDRSELNQEMFKQKLKRLGSTNFFLKRANQQKSEEPTKRMSIGDVERANRVSFRNDPYPF